MAECHACKAPVWFAQNSKTGRQMILDRETSDEGTVIKLDDGRVRVLTKAELDATRPQLPGLADVDVDELADRPRWRDHHATCTDPARFRR